MALSWLFECSPCGVDPAQKRSQQIDQLLRDDCKRRKRQVNVLLLGSGESGKSTFLKQMIIIHGHRDFTAEELRDYRHQIYQNVINGMGTLLQARHKFNLPWAATEAGKIARLDQAAQAIETLSLPLRSIEMVNFCQLAPVVRQLWEDKTVQTCYDRRREFQLTDSVKFFFENILRISQPDYVPTNTDILLCRKATRSMSEHLFYIQKVPFMFTDVGGQRPQRHKWFQYFDGITSILFLVASNEYDQALLEDRRTNRLNEAINVFDTIVNNRQYEKISIILFLNKTDLLTEKVPHSDIRQHFPDFKGDHRKVEDVQKYILNRFDQTRHDRSRQFFYHYTTAIDTENIRRVFYDCKEIILEQNLRSLMLQ